MSNDESIRVMVIQRKVADNQLSVCEFFCKDMEVVAVELDRRYHVSMDQIISPILDEDNVSRAGLLDMELCWHENNFELNQEVEGFSYRIIIDSYMAAPRDYSFSKETWELSEYEFK